MKDLTFLTAMLMSFMAVPAARADEPTTAKPVVTEKDWNEFFDRVNPLGFIQRMREAEARARAAENLKRLAQAVQKENGAPLRTEPNWQQFLLPYIEQSNIYNNYLTYDQGNRLGASVEPVGEAMRAQLNLSKKSGMLVIDVKPDSAGAKAGLQKFDILVKWDGKDVAADANEFAKLLNSAPAKKALPAVVLRKGKEVEIKDITLPESGPNVFLGPSDGASNTILFSEYTRNGWAPPIDNYGWGGNDAQSKVLTTTFRKDDRFTARYQEGSLVITLTGTIQKDKAAVNQVKVIDGSKEYRYESLDKMASEYRDKASDLLKSAEANKNNVQIK